MPLLGEGPFGDYPLGDFDLDYSESIADALDALLDKEWLERSWLFSASVRDADTSTDPVTFIDIDLSTDGHRSYPTDAVHKQFVQAVVSPYDISQGLGGRLHGQTSSSFGQVVLGDPYPNDNANSIRHYAAEDWVGREVTIRLGPRRGIWVQFATVAKLISRQISVDRSSLYPILDTYDFLFDEELQSSFYAGTGGVEGDASIQGQPKPILIGERDQIRPVLIDGTNFVYQVHDGSVDSVSAVKDKGVALSFDADYANYAALIAAVLTTNEYATCLAEGLVRVDAKPDGILTVNATGHDSSSYGYVNTASDILKLLAVTYAGLTDPDDLDLTSFSDLDTAYTATMGFYFDKPITVRRAMEEVHESAMSYGWLRPNKVLEVGRITDPSAATADFTLTGDDLELEPWRLDPYEIVVGRVIVNYKPYHRTLSETDLDASVSAATAEDLGKEYRTVQAEMTAAEKVQNPQFKTVELFTGLTTKADAQALADEQLALRKTPSCLARFAPNTGMIKYGVGQVFELTDTRLPASPKDFVILDTVNKAANASQGDIIEFICFGK